MKTVRVPLNKWFPAGSGHVEACIEEELLNATCKHALFLLAQTTPPSDMRITLNRREIVKTPCLWTRSWWARAIQWMKRKKFWSKLVPYPLECLAFATEINVRAVVEDLPEGILSNVHAQIADLKYRQGKEPKIILMGLAVMDIIDQSLMLHMSPLSPSQIETDFDGRLFGIPFRLTEKIPPTCAIVV